MPKCALNPVVTAFVLVVTASDSCQMCPITGAISITSVACALANPSNTTVSQSHRLWAHGGTCAPTSSLAICCNGETPTRKARVTTTSSCRPSIGQTQTAASEPTRQGQPARHPDTTSDPIEVWSTSHFMNPSHPPLMCECLTCQRGKSSTYIH